jgi:hypothetical protein
MSVPGAHEQITQTVLQWAGIKAQPHRFGGTEYLLDTREIGHVHGDHLVDIPFPSKVRAEIIAAGQAEAHHILPDSGWVSFYLRSAADVGQAIALLERSYQLAERQRLRKMTVVEEGEDA